MPGTYHILKIVIIIESIISRFSESGTFLDSPPIFICQHFQTYYIMKPFATGYLVPWHLFHGIDFGESFSVFGKPPYLHHALSRTHLSHRLWAPWKHGLALAPVSYWVNICRINNNEWNKGFGPNDFEDFLKLRSCSSMIHTGTKGSKLPNYTQLTLKIHRNQWGNFLKHSWGVPGMQTTSHGPFRMASNEPHFILYNTDQHIPNVMSRLNV